MPIVGEAVVLVRVLSNKLAGDIRKAVKDALNDANADIDTEGKKAGQRLNNSMADSVKKDMERVVGKEVVLATRRLAITAGRETDLLGRSLGNRFTASIGNGIRDNDSIIGRQLTASVTRAAGSNNNSEFDRAASLLGSRFSQSIGKGFGDGQPELQRQITAGVRRLQLTSGLTDAIRAAEPDVENTFRRVSADATRNTEKDWTNDLRRIFVSGIRGSTPDISAEYGRLLGNSFRTGVRNASRDTKDDFVGAARKSANFFRTELGQHNLAFRGIGQEWARFTGAGFGSGGGMGNLGEKAADDVGKGMRRGINRNRGGILKQFSGLGGEMFKELNFGFGAARMGKAIISAVVLAGPSIISGVGAVLTALAGEVVNFAAAIGPGLAGAAGVGLAAVSTLALNFGLLSLALSKAFKTVEGAKIKDAFKEIGNIVGTPIAHGMLEGMLDSVNRLKAALPGLTPLLERTGQAYGQIIERILDTVASAENMTRIGKILETNIGFLQNFKDGIGGLVNSFLILFAASKPFVDFIGEGIKRFGEWASASLTVSEANGNLAAWMDGMLQNFKDLWELLKDFGAGIANVFGAASSAGQKLFDALAGIGQRFRDWTDNPANQERMITFFEKAHTVSSLVFDMLGKIFRAAGNAFTNMDTDKLTHFFDTLTRVGHSIADIFSQIKEGAGGNLAKIFDDIGLILERSASSGVVTQFAQAISALALALADLLVQLTANPIGAKIAGIALAFLLFGGIIKTLLAPILLIGRVLATMAFEPLLAALGALSGPALAVAAAVAVLVGLFVLAYTKSQALRDAIAHLGELVGGAFMAVWDKLSPKLEVLWGKIERLASAIGDRLAPVIEFLAPIVARVVEFIGDLLGNIIDAIGGFIDIITGILTGDWSLVWEGVKEVLSAAWQQILTILGGVLSVFSIIWDTITAVVYNAGQVIVGIATSIWTGVSDVFRTVVGAIGSWLADRWNNIVNVFMGVWNNVTAFVSTVWNAIFGVFQTVVGAIGSWLAARWQNIVNVFMGVWNNVTAFVSTVWNAIWAVIETAVNGIISGLQAAGTMILNVALIPWRLMVAGIQAIWDLIGPWLTDRWNNIVNVAVGIWNNLAAFFTAVWNGIVAVVEFVWGYIVGFLSTIWNGIVAIATGVWMILTAVIGAAWDVISSVAEYVWNAIVTGLTGAWNIIVNVATATWNVLTTVIGAAWSAIQAAASYVWNAITTSLTGAWNIIKSVASTIWNAIVTTIVNIVDPIVGTLQDIWDNITSAVSSAWDGLSGIVRGIWEAISSAISDPVNAAWNVISMVVGWITGAVQTALDFVSRLTAAITAIPEAPTGGLVTANPLGTPSILGPEGIGGGVQRMLMRHLFEIPGLATGGIVNPRPGGSTFRLGEAGHPERVEPLDSSGLSVRDRALIKTIVASTVATMSGGGVNVDVRIGEHGLDQFVTQSIRRENSDLARRVGKVKR